MERLRGKQTTQNDTKWQDRTFPCDHSWWQTIYGVHNRRNYMMSFKVHCFPSARFLHIKEWNIDPFAAWKRQRHQLCFLLTRTLSSPLKFWSLPSPDMMFDFSGLTNHAHITCSASVAMATQELHTSKCEYFKVHIYYVNEVDMSHTC